MRNQIDINEFIIRFDKLLKKHDNKKLAVYKPKAKASGDYANIAFLSDLHFGSDILASETGYKNFGRKEETKRFEKVIDEYCGFKDSRRDKSRAVVIFGGDLIDGTLHDPRTGACLAEQFERAVVNIKRGLYKISRAYTTVDVWWTPGNHGRITSRHPMRAVNEKFDAFETMIACAVAHSFTEVRNTTFHIPKTPFLSIPLLGHNIFATHGDNVFSPGNPGQSINLARLEQQVNRINATLPDNKEYQVFVAGHVHTSSRTRLSNGVTVITNGALVPSSPYDIANGRFESNCSQTLWETSRKHAVGDMRVVDVNI